MEFNLEFNGSNLLLFMLPESGLTDKTSSITPDEAIKLRVIPQIFSLSGMTPTQLDHVPLADKIAKTVTKAAKKMGLGITVINKEQAYYKLQTHSPEGKEMEYNVYFRPLFMRRGCANQWPI